MLTSQIEKIKKEYPNNLMARHFDQAFFDSLDKTQQDKLQRMMKSGLEHPESEMGIYVCHADEYSLFSPYLDNVICDYHQVENITLKDSNWEINSDLDLARIDPSLANSSMRVRVGRNVAEFPLPASMSQDDRVAFENVMINIFKKLIKNPLFGGRYVSLTPDCEYEISNEQYAQLVAEHKMFKDMSGDPYLASAGINGNWPYGRGMYISEDEQFIIWVGEEDHLRIMVMKHGAMLNNIFSRLHQALLFIEEQGLSFAYSAPYGFITSCPTNLGTAMRASLHILLPKLTEQGQDLTELKSIAKSLKLSVRGADGEHSQAGKGGIVDISPTARLMVSEREIAQKLYQGIRTLWKLERNVIPK